MVFGAAAAADWTATYHGLSHRKLSEGDPLINGWQNQPALMVIAGTAFDVGSLVVWNHYVGRHHPKLAAVGLYVAAGFRTYLCMKGIKLIEAVDAANPSGSRR
jgi:hypothetical protein